MKTLLAVSGGIDSMYMLHRAPELFPGASFAVAHCNFTLRGEDSDEDENEDDALEEEDVIYDENE